MQLFRLPGIPANRQLRLLAALLLVMTTVFVPTAAFAQDGDIAPADIVNDEGGPVVVTGEMNYTNRSLRWAWPADHCAGRSGRFHRPF